MPRSDDEFAEFETDEATFDAMMAEAEPAEIVAGPPHVEFTISQVDESSFRVRMPRNPLLSVSTSVAAVTAPTPRLNDGRLTVHQARNTEDVLAS